MTRRLLIFGGTGFLGQALIQQALKRGYQVTSVSRSGRPKAMASWQEPVKWVAGDVFQPEAWQEELADVDVVIDAVGIIREQAKKGLTYQRMNVDVAQLLAEQSVAAGIPFFVYISANRFTHLFLQAYFSSKQTAGVAVKKSYPQAIVIRPSLIVGKKRKGTKLALTFGPLIRWFFPLFYPKTVEETAQEILDAIDQISL